MFNTERLEKIKRVNKNLVLIHSPGEQEALVAEYTLQLISDYEKLLKRLHRHDAEMDGVCERLLDA